MFNLNSFKQKSPQQRFLFILGLVMFLFYLVLGGYADLWDYVVKQIQPMYRIMLGMFTDRICSNQICAV